MAPPLAHETYAGRTEPVLAIHGVSSHRKLWLWLHEVAPEITLLAPDLRGRADSIGLGPPYGLDAHVADLVALLDDQGLQRVPVVGMSMGGFVAVRLADQHPERVASLTLVDGGPPMSAPAGLTRELLPQVFAGRIGRLGREWGSVAEFADYFCGDVAPMLDPADPMLRDYLAHDLGPDGRVRLDGDALLDDAADIYFEANPWQRLSTPTRFLHAQWSVGPDSPPMYGPEQLAAVTARGVSPVLVPGVDHAGTVMTEQGAAATAEQLRDALAEAQR